MTLVRQFVVASTVVIFIGMAAMGVWVADRIKTGVVQNAAADAAHHMDQFIAPLVQELAEGGSLSRRSARNLDDLVQSMVLPRIALIKVWHTDGTIAYSNWKELAGRRFPLTSNLRRALGGSIAAEFAGASHLDEGVRLRQLDSQLLEIYAPVYKQNGSEVIAVAEYYVLGRELARELRRAVIWSWLVVGAIALLMISALFGIVLSGSRTIDDQGRQLQFQVAELQTLLEQNQELRQRVERARQRSANINERLLRRVGADLHDGPAQLLGLVLLLLHSIEDAKSSAERHDNLEHIRGVLSDALRDIRTISSGLVLPEINGANLESVLKLAVRAHVTRTGTEVECELSPLPPEAPEAIKVCAYRFVQEALNNSFKHAGGKSQKVLAAADDRRIVIEVSDHGPGLREECSGSTSVGLGLLGLRDRIETIGGNLTISSSASGVALTADFDLEARALEPDNVGNRSDRSHRRPSDLPGGRNPHVEQ